MKLCKPLRAYAFLTIPFWHKCCSHVQCTFGLMEMKKALLTLAAVGFLSATSHVSATTISNSAKGLSLYPFGTPNTVTYGEVFTAPITGTLSSFTLSLDSPGVTNLYGGIGVWGGSFPRSTLARQTIGPSASERRPQLQWEAGKRAQALED